ncbi:MAG: hypothetical protein ACR2RV_11785, partial [Verrucomicrobiales bacterium]
MNTKLLNGLLGCLLMTVGQVCGGPGAEPGRLGVPLGRIVEIQATVRAGAGEGYLLDLTSIEGIALPSLGRMQFRVEPMASGHG